MNIYVYIFIYAYILILCNEEIKNKTFYDILINNNMYY